MKALFVSNDPAIFTEASAVRARMRSYANAIGELHILSSARRDAREERDGNLFLHPVHVPKLFRVRVLTSRARSLIQKYGIEVVSAQDPFEHGRAALRAARGTPAKLHIQVHTDFLSPWFVKGGSAFAALLNRYRQTVADEVLPSAHGIRVVSERVKTSLVARYGSRIPEPAVIPIAVDAALPASIPLPPHPFTFAIIAVGRLEPEKRIEDILAALKFVNVQYKIVGLFIVGDGRERRRLEKLIRTLGLDAQVLFLGERPDARGLMGSAQAFVQASAYEGYGRTLVEAALAEVPIITTDVGIVGDVFKKDEDALVVPIAKPIAYAHAIIQLLEDNNMRENMKIHAKEKALGHLASVSDLPGRIAADLEAARLHR
ncbi:MAG: glycosyltransferase [Minisyncoccia bacterium]